MRPALPCLQRIADHGKWENVNSLICCQSKLRHFQAMRTWAKKCLRLYNYSKLSIHPREARSEPEKHMLVLLPGLVQAPCYTFLAFTQYESMGVSPGAKWIMQIPSPALPPVSATRLWLEFLAGEQTKFAKICRLQTKERLLSWWGAKTQGDFYAVKAKPEYGDYFITQQYLKIL